MKYIGTRLNDAEHREFEDLAGRLGLSASDTLRYLIHRAGKDQQTAEKLDQVLARLEAGGGPSMDAGTGEILARLAAIEAGQKNVIDAIIKLAQKLTSGAAASQPAAAQAGPSGPAPSYAVWAASQPALEGETREQRIARLQREYQTKFVRNA